MLFEELISGTHMKASRYAGDSSIDVWGSSPPPASALVGVDVYPNSVLEFERASWHLRWFGLG